MKNDTLIIAMTVIFLLLAVILITVGVTMLWGVAPGILVLGIACLAAGLMTGSQ